MRRGDTTILCTVLKEPTGGCMRRIKGAGGGWKVLWVEGAQPWQEGDEKCMIHVHLEEAPTAPAWIWNVGVQRGWNQD